MSAEDYPQAVARHLAADGWDTSATAVGDDAVVVAGTRGSGADEERLLAMVVPGADATVTPKHLKYLVQKSRERDVDRRVLSTRGSLPATVSEHAAEHDVDILESDAVTGGGGAADAVAGSDDGDPDPTTTADGPDPNSESPDGSPVREPSDAAGYGGPAEERVDDGYGSQHDGSRRPDHDVPRQPRQDRPGQQPQGGQPQQNRGRQPQRNQGRQPQHNQAEQPQWNQAGQPQHNQGRQPQHNQEGRPQHGEPGQPGQRAGNGPQENLQQPAQHAPTGDRPPSREQARGSLAAGQGGGPSPNGPRGGRGAGNGDVNDSLVTTRRAVLFGGLGALGVGGYAMFASGSDDSEDGGPGSVGTQTSNVRDTDGPGSLPGGTDRSRSTPTSAPGRLQVETSSGHKLGGNRVGVVRLAVKLAPGSGPVDLSDATVQWVGSSGTYTLVARSASAEGADAHFGVRPFRDTDGSVPVLNADDDRFELVFDLGTDHVDADNPDAGTVPAASSFGDQLPEGGSVSLQITTRSGTDTTARLTVPEVLPDGDAVQL